MQNIAANNTVQVSAAERQLRLALFVREHGPVSRKTIQDMLPEYAVPESATKTQQDSARRLFERDKSILAEQGIVLSHDAGLYTLDQQASICQPLELQPEQASLLRAVCSALIADQSCPFASELRMVLVKMSEELEAPDMLPARPASAVVGIAPQGSSPAAVLRKVRTALDAGKTVRFEYSKSDGSATQREVAPQKILAREGRWLLAGIDTATGEKRTFRLSRMSKVSAGSRNAAAPEFDLGEWRILPFQLGSTAVDAAVRFSAETAWRAAALTGGMGKLTAAGDGSLVWTVSAADPGLLASWCIENGPGIQPVEPAAALNAYQEGLRAAQLACKGPHSPSTSASAVRKTRVAAKQPGNVKAENLLVPLLALLERAGRISIPQAAQLLNATEDAVYTALEELLFAYDSAAGIRLELGERGTAFAMLEQSGQQFVRLTNAELAALTDALAACGIAADSPLVAKIEAAKGPVSQAASQGSALLMDAQENGHVAQLLATACEDESRRLVTISYMKDGAAQASSRSVVPLQLISQDGHRYLRAWCKDAQAVRDFRIDRIAWAQLTEERCALQQAEMTAVASRAKVRFSAQAQLPEWPGARAARAADGSWVVSVDWLGSRWLPKHIAAHMGKAAPVEPPSLIEATEAYAAELLLNC